MMNIWKWIKNNPNRFMFLIPIILVAVISISHVVTWYDIANPINWAIYLSIAIEIGAMTALVAATNQIKGGVWFMFGLVTFIQMVGNIFYSYKEIDESGELFKSWIELTGPIWEMLGTETTDTIGLKRYLAYLEGGLLPIISLTSLHFFVKYDKEEPEDVEVNKKEYYKSRNKHIEKLVSDKEGMRYNPMTEHPEDIYYPPSKNEKTEITLSVPEGKEFNVGYPIKDEISETKIEDTLYPELSMDKDEALVGDITFDDIEENIDKRIIKYLPNTEMGDEEDIPELPKKVKTPKDVKKEILQKKIVKQPLKPSKSKIKRID